MTTPPSTRKTKIILLAGLSAAGKTSIGERMKDAFPAKWIHFDGDTYMVGGDPIKQSGQVHFKADDECKETADDNEKDDVIENEEQEKKKVRIETIKKAFAEAVAEGYNKLFVSEEPNHESFERFYNLMCEDIIHQVCTEEEKSGGRSNIIVTHSVYCARTRAYIKARLEELLNAKQMESYQVQVVVIQCSKESLVDRRLERAKKQAIEEAHASSFEQYLVDAMAKGFPIKEPTEEAFREYVSIWNNGFEDAVMISETAIKEDATPQTDMDTNNHNAHQYVESALGVTDGIGLDEMFETFCNLVL